MKRDMMSITDPTPEEEQAYVEWAAQTEPKLRSIAAQFRPWIFYRVIGRGNDTDSPREDGQRVSVRSFVIHPQDSVEYPLHPIEVIVRSTFHGVSEHHQRLFRVDPEELKVWEPLPPPKKRS